MEKIVLILFALFSFGALGQNGSGTSGGGPGMVLKYVDSDGIARELIVEEGGLNVPAELMEQYLEELKQRDTNIVRFTQTDDVYISNAVYKVLGFESKEGFRKIGKALDVTTTSGDILDRQALRDLNPSWMRESEGEMWVSEQAPIVDYQIPSGEIIHFNSGPNSNQDIYWNPDLD